MGNRRIQKLAVALDTSDWEDFVELCDVFGPAVDVLKVGLEAHTRWGAKAVREAQRHGPRIFLDLKLHDIPNTVAGAVRAARDLGIDLLTVHAAGGPAMLEAAVEASGAGDTKAGTSVDGVGLLAVTVLTSLDHAALEALDLPGGSNERARRWAKLARAAGCAGAVCSPREAAALRLAEPRPFLLVTPGVRLTELSHDDQARVAGPSEALAAGADLLVVGRPLTRADDREAALGHWARAIAGSRPG